MTPPGYETTDLAMVRQNDRIIHLLQITNGLLFILVIPIVIGLFLVIAS